MITINDQFQLDELEQFKTQLICKKISTCQDLRLEYYTNYLFDYVYRYQNDVLKEVYKNECKNWNI